MTPPVGLCNTEDVKDGEVNDMGGLIVSGVAAGGLVIGVENIAPVVLGPVMPALSINPAASIRSSSAMTAGFFFCASVRAGAWNVELAVS